MCHLASLRHRIDVDAMDADFLPFVGIDSETDLLAPQHANVWWLDSDQISDIATRGI